MGLLFNDDDLLYGKFGTGSAYRVRVWRITDRGVKKVTELSSWHAEPEFLSDRRGRPVIRVYEGGFDARLTLRRVDWIYVNGHFLKHRSPGR